MTALQLATDYWRDAVNRTDTVRLHNMIVSENKANKVDGSTRRQRPGLVARSEVGDGPIQKMWQQDGTLGGAFLTVSGGALYVGASHVGSVGSTGVQIAGGADRAVIVADGVARRTDGTSLAIIVMPDDVPGFEGAPAPVASVRYINGFFLLSVKGDQRFYWIQPSADDPDPLDFASAERSPDAIVSIAISGDEIWFLGGAGEEVWSATGDADAPFQRINGRVYQNGCADADSVAEMDTAIFWVSASRSVVAAQGSPSALSDDAIDGILEADSAFKGWPFKLGGHAFYVLTTDTISLAFDLKSKKWSRFSSYGHETWRSWTGAQQGALVVGGDSRSGKTWTLDFGAWQDDGEALVRELSASVANTGPPVGCASLSLGTSVGWAPSYEYEPVVEVRWSDDQGAAFSTWRPMLLGKKGQYSKDAVTRSLGLIQRPGRTFIWRMTDNALWRADYARLNEA